MNYRNLPKEYQPVAKKAIAQGWKLSLARSGHVRWTSPSGVSVFGSRTPSDKRSLLNIISKLRREGFRP